MSTTSPLVSEFESTEQEVSHTAWLKGKVRKSLDDQRPGIPHDEAMAEIAAVIAEAETKTND